MFFNVFLYLGLYCLLLLTLAGFCLLLLALACWGCFGALSVPLLLRFVFMLAHFGSLGRSWALLGALGALLGRSWELLGRSGVLFFRFGAFLGRFS